MKTKQIRVCSLALAFVAAILPPSAICADAIAPTIIVDQSHNYPRLTWTNVPGQVYDLLTSGELVLGKWSPLVTLTADSKTATWTDEAQPAQSLFYYLSARADTNWASKLQLALDRGRKSSGAIGAAAVVISSNGVWQGTSGFSNPKTRNSIQPQMRFGIGSITKTFTTALIMQLVEEGKLGMEDPLGKWLPDYPNITNTITVRQLLSHTSGVYNFTENSRYWPMVSKTNKLYLPEETLTLVRSWNFLPGKGYSYSNTGFVLLGMVAEAVTKNTVAAEIRRRFLDPLQLRETYLGAAEPESGDRAHPFSANYTGSVLDVSDRPWLPEWSVAWSAGAMVSTANDLAHWIQALYGGSVLKPESLNEMTKWTSLSGSTYGLGTVRMTSSKGEFWGHEGEITGYLASGAYSPTRQVTVIVLINQDNSDSVAIWNGLVNAL